MFFLVSLLFLFTAVLGQLPVRRPEHHETRIVGGEFVPVQHVPHQAVIRQLNLQYTHQCGAVLIAPEWLLSAEHCLKHRDIIEYPIDVYLGVSRVEQIANYSPNQTVVKRRVVRYFRGPRVEIGNRTEDSDLLLMKLDHSVTTSGTIKPIDLPEVGFRWASNQTGVVSGFGELDDDYQHPLNAQPRTLQSIRVPIISKKDCLAMVQAKLPEVYDLLRPTAAPESMLCAGYEKGHNVCYGDSGGPLAVCATPLREPTSGQLMCNDNHWRLAGIASKTLNGCGEADSPSLYVNVAFFTHWIRRVMKENSRLIDGELLPVEYFQHQAFIRQAGFQCSAVLVDPQWVLTAESCLQHRITESPITVILGLERLAQLHWNDNRKRGFAPATQRRAIRHIRGPRVQIGNRTQDSDLALLKLDQKVDTSWDIKPIELPTADRKWTADQLAVTSGLGIMRTTPWNTIPDTLQYRKVPILSKSTCLAMLQERFQDGFPEVRRTVAPETVLCAGDQQGGCYGDLGGALAVCATPLQVSLDRYYDRKQLCKDNRWLLAGVVSGPLRGSSDRCDEPNNPALHSNVPVFAEWIRWVIRNN